MDVSLILSKIKDRATCCTLLLLLLVTCYQLSCYQTIYQNYLTTLEVKSFLKTTYQFLLLLVGSILLLIERTMSDPLYLWVINSLTIGDRKTNTCDK